MSIDEWIRNWYESIKDAEQRYERNIIKPFKCEREDCPMWRKGDRCIASICIKLRRRTEDDR